jgi:hypothetical protein
MKLENISINSNPSELSLKSPGTASARDDTFGSILGTERAALAESVPLQEGLSKPRQTIVSLPSLPITSDFKQALAVYERKVSASHSIQRETEFSTKATISSTPVQGGSSPASESTVSLSSVFKGIKNFLVRLFAPKESSSVQSDAAPVEAVEAESVKKSAARFLSRLATVLTFGLWRPDGGGEPSKVSEVSAASASQPKDTATETKDSSLQVVNSVDRRFGNSASPTKRTADGSKSKGTADGSVREIPAEIQKAIADAAKKHDLPPELIAAVIKVESNFNPHAVSKEGARGLMQLMPATARTLSVKNAFDIRQNIDGGCRYLKTLLDRFDGKVDLALAAYSAGPNAVEKFNGIPPYRQTQRYIAKVRRYS